MMGMHGSYEANMAASNADLVIGIGNRMDDRAIGRFNDFNHHAKLIHVDIDAGEHGKNLPTEVPILGDVKAVLPQLRDATRRNSHVDWIRWIDEVREKHAHSMAIPSGPQMTSQGVIKRISERCDDETVIVTGVGQHQMWAAQHMRFSYPHQLITSGGLGTMGFEVPAAMGAQVAKPDALVWSICGDGGFQMTLQELATIVEHNIDIKFAIFNNGFHGMVRQWQEFFYEKDYVETRFFNPDFVKLAEAYNMTGFKVAKKADVRPIIEEAQSIKGPVLIDFVVESEENVYPMIPAGASVNEMLETPPEKRLVDSKDAST